MKPNTTQTAMTTAAKIKETRKEVTRLLPINKNNIRKRTKMTNFKKRMQGVGNETNAEATAFDINETNQQRKRNPKTN
jgi:hypothetical protein